MKTKQRKNKKRHFTYIEMLIVLGIIAALFAMLVPGLLRAKEMAKKVYCMNNLNQTFKVIAMYNNDQNVPPY
ncbi:MAG TPA: type II secretion system protein, partial [Victivallales bacterium]|nr:type II secretion system protein [Victivallales bacterium]